MQTCPYCTQAKGLLEQRGIPYETIMIDDWSDEAWDELYQKTKMKTVPQIVYGDRVIGGYTDLAELNRKDELASLKS